MNFRSSKGAFLRLLTAGLCVWLPSAKAVDEYILNGNFDDTTVGPNRQIVVNGDTDRYTQLNHWTTSDNTQDLIFLFSANAGATTGAQGVYYSTNDPFRLWPGISNTVGPSPQGGNYVASDGDSTYNVPLTQSITGLSIGQQYELTFYWAAGQQRNFDGPTTERWQVSLGSETYSTPTFSLANHDFSGWMTETMTFTATTSTSLLSFLAIGTPNGLPPFVLLDGVSMTAVPEPAAGALVVVGLFGCALIRRRLKKSNS